MVYRDDHEIAQEYLSTHFQMPCQPVFMFLACFQLIAFDAESNNQLDQDQL